jgi:hypothetical protein
VKWDKPTGAVQYSADRAYCIMEAATGRWVAYRLSGFQTSAEKLGEPASDEAARQLCDDHERALISARQIA